MKQQLFPRTLHFSLETLANKILFTYETIYTERFKPFASCIEADNNFFFFFLHIVKLCYPYLGAKTFNGHQFTRSKLFTNGKKLNFKIYNNFI